MGMGTVVTRPRARALTVCPDCFCELPPMYGNHGPGRCGAPPKRHYDFRVLVSRSVDGVTVTSDPIDCTRGMLAAVLCAEVEIGTLLHIEVLKLR